MKISVFGYFRRLVCDSSLMFTVSRNSLCLTTSSTFCRYNQQLTDSKIRERKESFAISERQKFFKERENLIAHKVIEKYNETVVIDPLMNLDKLSSNSNHVFKDFSTITVQNFSNKSSLEDKKFDVLLSGLVKCLSGASFEEVLCTLCCLCLWPPSPKTYSPNFKLIWNAADKECTKRLGSWATEQKLLVGDYWFHLKLSRITNYNIHMIKNLVQESSLLKPNQIVQLMFYVSLQRNIPQNLLSPVEKLIASIVEDFSIPELNVICLGFFKSEICIQNLNTIKTIIKRLTDNIDVISEENLVGILKCLRKSFQPHITEFYVPLLKNLATNIKRWTMPAAIHSVLLSQTTNIFEPLILDYTIDEIQTSLNDVRTKDIFKVMQCLSNYNYNPSMHFHEAVSKEMLKKERENEIMEHSRDIVFITLFQAYLNYYNVELLRKVFDPQFVQYCNKNFHDIVNVLSVIDYCVEIEYSSYTGPRLNKKQRSMLNRHQGNYPEQYSSYQKNISSQTIKKLYNTTKEIYGDSNVCVRHVLPHFFNPDVIIRLKSKNNDSLSSTIQSFPSDEIIKPPPDEIWVCIVACSVFAYAFKSNQIGGLISMKKRQLECLGYKVLLMPYRHVLANDNMRRSFLEKRFKTFEKEIGYENK